jgi:hypothetical protein
MSQSNSNIGPKTGHLFTVEILIEDTTNGLAMEKLLHLLNVDAVKDYRIVNGIGLGKLIELNTKPEGKSSIDSNKKAASASPVQAQPSAPLARKSATTGSASIVDQLEKFKANNTLIRLTVIKAQGIKLSLPCRILNFDSNSQNVTVYHDDEKKVYLFKLNEIEDYVASN